MAYLIRQNNQYKKNHVEILRGLRKVSAQLSLKETSVLDELQKRSYIVTNNAIKRTENYVTALEDILEIQKQKVVSNTFKPKTQKLTTLKKRTDVLLEKVNSRKSPVLTK